MSLAVHAAELRLRLEDGVIGRHLRAGKHGAEGFHRAASERRLVIAQSVVIAQARAKRGEIVIRRRGAGQGGERERGQGREKQRGGKASRKRNRARLTSAAAHSGNFRSLVAVARILPEASSAFTVQR